MSGLDLISLQLPPRVNVRHHDLLINLIQQVVKVSLIKFQSFVCEASVSFRRFCASRSRKQNFLRLAFSQTRLECENCVG